MRGEINTKQKTFEEIYNILKRSQKSKTYEEILENVKKNQKALSDTRTYFTVVIAREDGSETLLYDLIDARTFARTIEPYYILDIPAVFQNISSGNMFHEILITIMM